MNYNEQWSMSSYILFGDYLQRSTPNAVANEGLLLEYFNLHLMT